MRFLFAVDDESVARGAALRPVAAGVLLAAGVVGSGLTAWATATSPVLVTPEADAIVRAFVVGLYMIAGVYVWVRRPHERFGQVLVLISLAYALTTFNTSGNASLYTLGRVYTAVWIVLMFAALLSFPSGRLTSRVERTVVRGFALATAIVWTLIVLVVKMLPAAGVLTDCGKECPENAFRVVDASSPLSRAPTVAMNVITIAITVVALVLLTRKAWSPAGIERRTVRPVLLAAVAIVVSYAAWVVHPSGATWRTLNLVVTGTAAIVLPIAFVLAPLRGELFVSRALWRGLSVLDYSRLSPSISVRIVDNGVGRLPAATERAIYFAASEAIQNATRHSGAGAVVMTLEPLGDVVEVTIADDGGGFDDDLVPPGAGLTGIRDRIGSIGGDVEVTSAPGAGTVLRYLVPVGVEIGAAT